ncbi:dihydrofolate reductase family protein [Parasalinivibrio latis]|uniref:dihydrofolate reductase family protein n=1 Tax=Parasalinivibrio latis TaxID=2952610 RepID=UPI0030E4F79C
MANIVYIATSLDGYIADREGGLDWLMSVPNSDNSDFGFAEFMSGVDALVMGRNTFETVVGFGQWPYEKPVFVVSNSLESIPESHIGKAFLIKGAPEDIVRELHGKGFYNLYIDGGRCIQGFMAEGLIDDLIISTIPVVLGGGVSLFGELPALQHYDLVSSEVLVNAIVKSHYKRNTK